MARLKIDTNFCEIHPTHSLGRMYEDGTHPLRRCYDLELRTEDGRQWAYTMAFATEEEAREFAQRVFDYGSINPDKWYCSFDPHREPELPDYVTEWWMPEFN